MDRMSDLDALASRAVFAAKLLERAIHDDGPWTIQIGEQDHPAEREFTNTGVLFNAVFDLSASDEPVLAVLRCAGRTMDVKPISVTGGNFALSWAVSIQTLIQV